jgi:hypothetical protein
MFDVDVPKQIRGNALDIPIDEALDRSDEGYPVPVPV